MKYSFAQRLAVAFRAFSHPSSKDRLMSAIADLQAAVAADTVAVDAALAAFAKLKEDHRACASDAVIADLKAQIDALTNKLVAATVA